MDYWMICMQKDLTDWLLNGEPWVTYRMLIDILGLQESERRVLAARKGILDHRLIENILDRRNAAGYWGASKDIHTWWPRARHGRFVPESIVKVWSDFDFGQKNEPSRWMTFLALRIAKRIYR